MVWAVLIALMMAGCAGSLPTSSSLPTETATTAAVDGGSSSTTEPSDCPPPGDSPGDSGVGDPVLPLLGNGGYDVSHYDLEFFIDPSRDYLDAVVTIEASAKQSLTTFNLDYSGPPVTDLTVNQEPAAYCRVGGELVVGPAPLIRDGETFTVSVAYAGKPTGVIRPGAPQEGWLRVSDEQVTAGGLWGAEAAYMPVNATNLDKATFHMEVTVPEPLAVAGVGTLVETRKSERGTTYVWASEVPTPPSRVFIATGRFELERSDGAEGIRYENLMPPETPPELRENLDKASTVITVLSEAFGPFPFDRLGFTFIPDHPAFNAISAQTRIVVLGTTSVGDAFLAHEIAHQWFGNSVTPATSQDDWLSEGFATFAEALWVEANVGPDASDTLARFWWQRMGESTRHLGAVDAPEYLGDYVAYFRGAATLYALRFEMGDDAFFRTLRRFASDYRHSPATTEDFVSIAESESNTDLSDFFETWLYDETVPPMPARR